MTKRLTVQDRALIATRYEMWQSVIELQRWWRSQRGRHATLHPNTIKNCHQKLMTTGSVCDTERSGRHSSSRSPEVVDTINSTQSFQTYCVHTQMELKTLQVPCRESAQKVPSTMPRQGSKSCWYYAKIASKKWQIPCVEKAEKVANIMRRKG